MKRNLFNRFLTRRFRREEIANSDEREAAVCNSAQPGEEIDFNSADGWFKIAPYGVFPGRVPGRPQHVTPEGAGRMIAEFNSVLGRLGRAFRGLPIYHGHPDVDPTIWTDDRRLGRVTKLEARADGLWGYAEWNSLGEDNKREGWWIYPSPRWDAAKGKARMEPDRLLSIGLTNTPRIQESDPVFNSDTPTTMDPIALRKSLGLPPEATDEECFAKIEALNAAATDAETRANEAENAKTAAEGEATTAKTEATTAKSEAETAKREKDEMANALAAERTARNTELLDGAEKRGQITKAERAAWSAKLEGEGRDEVINSLGALKPKLNTRELDLRDRREQRGATETKREEVVNATHALMEKEGIDYDTAWRRVKKDQKFAGYFAGDEG